MKSLKNLYKSTGCLVGLNGFEPLTPTMSRLCAKRCKPLILKEKQPFFSAKKAEKTQKIAFLNQKLTKTALLYIAVISPLFRVRTVLKVLCVISAGLCANAASADDLILGEFTHHFKKYSNDFPEIGKTCAHEKPKSQFFYDYKGPQCKRFSTSQPLIGYDTGKYTFFAMRNSFDDDSIAVVRTIRYESTENIRMFAAIGVATGYSEYIMSWGGVSPVGYIGMDIHLKDDRFGLVITCAREFCGAGLRIRIN